jgi:beta-N-acetylhexosaminidase
MTTLLREKIGFKGLAVTDDLAMNGADEAAGSISEACVKAVEAGNDLLMISKLLGADDSVWQRLLAAYREKPAFRERAREAARRVVETKIKYLKPQGKKAMVPDVAGLAAKVPDPEAAAFFKEQAFRSATLLRPVGLPFVPKGRLIIASPFKEFLEEALAAYPSGTAFHFSYEPASAALPAELAAFDLALAGSSDVIICVSNGAGMDFAVRAHEAGKRVAIVSAQSPAPLSRAPWADAAVAVYSFSRESLRAGIAVLSGKEKAQGKLPLRLPK